MNMYVSSCVYTYECMYANVWSDFGIRYVPYRKCERFIMVR